jgi:hypothetical protein
MMKTLCNVGEIQWKIIIKTAQDLLAMFWPQIVKSKWERRDWQGKVIVFTRE